MASKHVLTFGVEEGDAGPVVVITSVDGQPVPSVGVYAGAPDATAARVVAAALGDGLLTEAWLALAEVIDMVPGLGDEELRLMTGGSPGEPGSPGQH
jgi:hypothetical protein